MSKKLKIILIAVTVGLLSGTLSSLFLHALSKVTIIRQEHPLLIWGLPLFGLLFAFIVKKIPHHINQGVPYILEELENPQAHVSPWMAPFIFISSLGTHIFGGSAGREGVGVIMGASAAHLIPNVRHQYEVMRPYLIYSGMAAGFSSIFGTPLAAIVFAFELHHFKHIRKLDLLGCTIGASFFALLVSHFLGPAHQHFHVEYDFSIQLVPYVLIAVLTSSIGSHVFYWGLKGYTKLISHLCPHLPLKLFVGSVLVSGLVYLSDSYQYIGIGTDVIATSFSHSMSPYDFIMKCLLTVMTLSIGFKGGEVTPLFFMGSTFSNGIASHFKYQNFALSSALGMVSLFGAVTATPFASAVMGAELFGPKVGLLCLCTCYLARKLMGNHTVYRL